MTIWLAGKLNSAILAVDKRVMIMDLSGSLGSRNGCWMRQCSVLGQEMQMGIVEMIGSVSERINFKFSKEVLGKFLQEPVDDHPSFDTALAVKDEDNFAEFGLVKRFFYHSIAVSDIVCGVVEVSLD
jgi:hypothetical protein